MSAISNGVTETLRAIKNLKRALNGVELDSFREFVKFLSHKA